MLEVPKKLQWRQRAVGEISTETPVFIGDESCSESSVRSPIEYFRDFMSDDVFSDIVEQSNLYCSQKDINKTLNLNRNELEQFVGMTFYMSIAKLPSSRMYWGTYTRVSQVADVMAVNRFEQIKSNLHFNDNTKMAVPNTDKLFKVRPLIDSLTKTFSEQTPQEYLSIDEQVIPFKGKSSLKTYNPKKPKKWGYKVYILTSVDGVIHNMEFYSGAILPVQGKPDLKASSNIVLRLVQPIPTGLWHKLFFDNWFTGLPLMAVLWEDQIAAVGTVRSDRLLGCGPTLPSEKQMKRQGRGHSVIRTSSLFGIPLNVVRWFDNKVVSLVSTYAAITPERTARRWDKKAGQYVDIPQPDIIGIYNKHMGGVDLLDMLVALYRTGLRSKKWYLRIYFHLLDMCVVQAWLMYRRTAKSLQLPKKEVLSLCNFKLSVADSLMKQGKMAVGPKRGRPSLEENSTEAALTKKARKGPMLPVPQKAVRTDRVDHEPIKAEKRGRCKMPNCKGSVRVMCSKCKVHLCLTATKNCFQNFHK